MDTAKLDAIRRYVTEYNAALHALATRVPDKVMLAATETLAEPDTQHQIFDFLGVRGETSTRRHNVGGISDSDRGYRF